MRLAFSGGVSAEKVLSYLASLRAVNEWRGTLGREINGLLQDAERLRLTDRLASRELSVMATHLSGRQEVTFHFFAVCVGRIERFLPIAAKAAGYKIPKAQLGLLAPYRLIRDHYEHLEERLPVGTKYDKATAEYEEDGEWRIRIGLPVDSEGRIILKDTPVDVTTRGMTSIEALLRRHWDQLKVSALELVSKHFEDDPNDIPSPAEVKQELLASTERG